jgi:hypothetical protein
MRGREVEGKPEVECRSHTRLAFYRDLPVVPSTTSFTIFVPKPVPPFLVLTALAENRRSRISGGIPRPRAATVSAIPPCVLVEVSSHRDRASRRRFRNVVIDEYNAWTATLES